MDKLLFSFIKRYLIVPLSVAIVAIIATSIVMPKIITASQSDIVISAPEIDPSSYELRDYKKFSELKDGEYVASIESNELNISCAVCYNTANDDDSVRLQKQSLEPWNKGSVAIVGDNYTRQFKYLHNAEVGTEIKIDFYKNAVCTYKITGVSYNNSLKSIPAELKKNNLVLCVPYNYFESKNGEKLYTFYFAELGGVKQWN